MKRGLGLLLVTVLVLAGTASAQRWAVGVKVPFSLETETVSNAFDVTTTEMWFGGLGTFEFYAHPTVGIELVAGYHYALSGKAEADTIETEFKRNIIVPFSVLLKYYVPMAEGSKLHPWLGCGPRVSIEERKDKVGDDYEKRVSFTKFALCHSCILSGGLDFDIARNLKLGGALDVAIGFVSQSPEAGYESSYPEESTTTVNLGAGLVFKYAF